MRRGACGAFEGGRFWRRAATGVFSGYSQDPLHLPGATHNPPDPQTRRLAGEERLRLSLDGSLSGVVFRDCLETFSSPSPPKCMDFDESWTEATPIRVGTQDLPPQCRADALPTRPSNDDKRELEPPDILSDWCNRSLIEDDLPISLAVDESLATASLDSSPGVPDTNQADRPLNRPASSYQPPAIVVMVGALRLLANRRWTLQLPSSAVNHSPRHSYAHLHSI